MFVVCACVCVVCIYVGGVCAVYVCVVQEQTKLHKYFIDSQVGLVRNKHFLAGKRSVGFQRKLVFVFYEEFYIFLSCWSVVDFRCCAHFGCTAT